MKLGYIHRRSSQERLIIFIAEKFTLSKITVTIIKFEEKLPYFLVKNTLKYGTIRNITQTAAFGEKNKTLTLFCVRKKLKCK